jgi:bifunctional DNase/RNase
MIQVTVGGIALDAAGQHVILLRPVDALAGQGRILPIWIGALEATAILIAVEGAATPRPLTHDLFHSALEALDAEVAGVRITRIEDGTFYAEIALSSPGGGRVVDARPSDAVALAVRGGAPIHVADDVLAEAGIVDIIAEGEEKEDVEEFRRFLDEVDPDDFRGEG